jgi:hypothetical protein
VDRVKRETNTFLPFTLPRLQIANGVAGYKLDHPDISDDEAIKILLPEAKFVEVPPREGEEKGEMAMQVDGGFLSFLRFRLFLNGRT